MGFVYLAERSDGALKKQVAIKLLQPGRMAPAFVSGFQQEREILASLDHPTLPDSWMREQRKRVCPLW